MALNAALTQTPIGASKTSTVIRVTHKGVITSSLGAVKTVFSVDYSNPAAVVPVYATLATNYAPGGLGTSMFSKAMARLHSDLTINQIQYSELTNPLAAYYNDTTGYAGTDPGAAARLPAEASFCINLNSALHGKMYRGRLFFGPLIVTDVTQEKVSGASAAAWAAIAAAASATITDGTNTWTPCVVPNFLPHNNPAFLGMTSNFPQGSGKTPSWLKSWNEANGITPLNTPVNYATMISQIIWTPVTTGVLKNSVSYLKNRKLVNRRSFSRVSKKVRERLFREFNEQP